MTDLNRAGRTYASSLIADGKVDKTAAWTFTSADGNALLGDAGSDWTTYGKCHLGVDSTESFDTKDHWKYPFAKGGTLYRSALIAIRSRAGQQRDKAIGDAAGALLDEIDGDSDRTHENSATRTPSAGVLTVSARPPRIEVDLRNAERPAYEFDVTEESISKWCAGLRAAVKADDQTANIEMFGVIGEDFWSGGGITAKLVSSQLRAIGDKDVTVLVNSPGGDMFEGIAIYNLLQQHKGSVTVKVLGLAASAASVIAMAGDDIQIGQGAFLMIHNCWVMAMGNRHDMQEVSDYLAPFDDALADIYSARSGQKKTACAAWMDAETFMNASQSVDRGFATGILPAAEVTEDKEATNRAKSASALRKADVVLARAGVPRSERRALFSKRMHSGTQDAAGTAGTTQDAGANGTQNAAEMIKAAQALFAK